MTRLHSNGMANPVLLEELLFEASQPSYDFVVLVSAVVEMVRQSGADHSETVLARHGRGQFLGELNLLTGQRLTCERSMVAHGPVGKA
ncbi:cyclic nucleotide-binding domain-containing protein [Mycobacterium stomatepiae]|nr:cyclic nucleotide-binding domain-containing protein [Mycobacterium stomatepiae]